LSDNQVSDGFFRLVGFIDSEDRGCDLVDLEPGAGYRHALEGLIFRTWKRAAPVGELGLRNQVWGRESPTNGQRDECLLQGSLDKDHRGELRLECV
jgi:hypothetical protein